MKKITLFTAALMGFLVLAGCCTKSSCTAEFSPVGAWQMYGIQEDDKLLQVPVVMTFHADGKLTTVIENKDVRKSSWKMEDGYIVISQDGTPTVRLERKNNTRMEFEWKGDKYKKKSLHLVLKKK